MRILALDQATHCGWAHTCGQSGVWDLSIRKDESAGMRWIRFIGKLNEVLTNVGVDLLVFEAARNSRFGNATRVAGGFQSQVERWCAENKIEYRAYGPSEIKKHATGNGRASKEEMIDAAERKFKRVIESDNEADALMLLDLAKADYGA